MYVRKVLIEQQCTVEMCMLLVESMARSFGLENCPEMLWLCVNEAYGLSLRWVLRVREREGSVDRDTLVRCFVRENTEWYQRWRTHNPECVLWIGPGRVA